MPLSRRRFMRETALAAGGLALAGTAPAEKDLPMSTARPLFVATWPFGKAANEQALRTAEQGGSILDAVERGIHIAEADASNASVGLGGLPNAQGVVQLDACIMDGEGQRAGSVAAIEGILHPISVARRVMDVTKHVMLVGEGARQFALEQGFASVELLTEERRRAWEAWREKQDAAWQRIEIVEGCSPVPEGPGLGVEVDEAVIAHLAQRGPAEIPRHLGKLRLPDGHGLYTAGIPPLDALTGFAEGTIRGVSFAVWNDDGSEEFARLYERVEAEGSVLE